MFPKKQLQKSFVSLLIVFTFIFNGISFVYGQGDFVTSGRIGGSTSVYVFRGSSKEKKSNYAAKRRSTVQRTQKQRRVTRRTVAKQSVLVAKKNRDRRTINKVDPQDLEEIKIERKTPAEASLVLAGAGEYFVDKDEYEKAVGYFEQALELNPANKDAKLALSEVYTMLGDQALEKADEYTELAAKAVQENNSANIKKYLSQEKFTRQKAEKNFQRAIELDPKNSSAYASLGGYLDAQQDDENAQINYEKALELDPELTNVKAPLGIIYYQKGEIEKADKFISEALTAERDNAEIQYFRGLIRYKQNRNDEAKEALETSIRIDDENSEAHYYLGAVFSRLDDEKLAIREYIKATTLDPKFVNAWFDLGVAYYNQEQYQNAIEAFNKAVTLNMNQTDEEKRIYSESIANLAEAYRQTEQYDKAISKYRNAVDLVDDPELYSTFAFVLAREGKWSESIKTFEAVTQMKSDAISYANLGWAYYQESEYHKSYRRLDQQKASLLRAKSSLQTSLQKDPNLAASYLNLGLTLNDLGEYKDAINALDKATQLQRGWIFAVNELGKAYRQNGDLDKAVKQFEKAISMDKRYAEGYFGLGEAQLARGKTKEAKKAHQDLKKLDSKLADKLGDLIAKATF